MRALARLIAAIAGLALAICGVLLVVSAPWAAVQPAGQLAGFWHPWRIWLESHTWVSTPVRIIAAALVVIGLACLFLAIKARRNDVALHDPASDVVVVTDPRSLARLVGHQVREEHDVANASVIATRSRIRVSATGAFTDIGDLPERLRESVEQSVRRLPLRATPRVSVSVSPARRSR